MTLQAHQQRLLRSLATTRRSPHLSPDPATQCLGNATAALALLAINTHEGFGSLRLSWAERF